MWISLTEIFPHYHLADINYNEEIKSFDGVQSGGRAAGDFVIAWYKDTGECEVQRHWKKGEPRAQKGREETALPFLPVLNPNLFPGTQGHMGFRVGTNHTRNWRCLVG